MRKRTRAREIALQVLYELDITQEDPAAALENFWLTYEQPPDDHQIREFASELVKGVSDNRKLLDQKVAQYAANWELKRMAVVDRNILRMSCFELLFRDDIPPKVSINEAVELAKKYSGPEAGKFVNAILDKIKIERGR